MQDVRFIGSTVTSNHGSGDKLRASRFVEMSFRASHVQRSCRISKKIGMSQYEEQICI
jgi:hypothetical protein